MARDYVEILKRVEGHYPQALGTSSSQDVVLKAQLTGYVNDLIEEIDREQRWSLSFNTVNFLTAVGSNYYPLPFPATGTSPLMRPTFIDRAYLKNLTTGQTTPLKRYDKEELQRVFGDAAGVNNWGTPKYYSIQASPTYSGGNPTLAIEVYPAPDANGPETGDYRIFIEGYFQTPQIIEVQGSVTAASATLTVPSGTPTYLTDLGEPTASSGLGLNLSVRGGGQIGPGGLATTHVATWTAFPTATTITMGQNAITTIANTQVFFNSTNWMIRDWPHIILFGVLREVATYYGQTDKYAIFEQRFQDQMQRLRAYEYDVSRGKDAKANAFVGGNASVFRRPDDGGLVDVRGGELS